MQYSETTPEGKIHAPSRFFHLLAFTSQVLEECPSPFVKKHPEMREKLTKCATAYALQLKYKSAGTIEFLVDDITGDFFFLEMNTRLQVEHCIT